MTHRDVLEHRHHELVVIRCDVGLLEDRRHLELAGRDLVVPRDNWHAELVQLEFELRNASLHALRDATKVVVLKLLPARRRRTHERAATHHEVGAHRVVRAINNEVFLLGAHRGVDAVHALVAEEVEQFDGARGDDVAGTEERSDFVERFAVVANEDRRDAHRLGGRDFHNEERRSRIPRGVATRFPGGAQAAGGERRCIGLRLDQLFGAERLDRELVLVEREKGVVLLGGQSSLRLEPVAEMRDAARDGPLLHDLRNDRCDVLVEFAAELDGFNEARVDVLRQLVAHLARAEGVDAEVCGGRRAVFGVGGDVGFDG